MVRRAHRSVWSVRNYRRMAQPHRGPSATAGWDRPFPHHLTAFETLMWHAVLIDQCGRCTTIVGWRNRMEVPRGFRTGTLPANALSVSNASVMTKRKLHDRCIPVTELNQSPGWGCFSGIKIPLKDNTTAIQYNAEKEERRRRGNWYSYRGKAWSRAGAKESEPGPPPAVGARRAPQLGTQ